MLGCKTSLLSGGCTLVVMILPTIIRTTQEALKTVPQSYREGALGLGASKWHMTVSYTHLASSSSWCGSAGRASGLGSLGSFASFASLAAGFAFSACLDVYKRQL